MFDQAADGIVVGNSSGILSNVNTAICKLLEYSKEEIIGKDMTFIFEENSLKENPLRLDLVNEHSAIIKERMIKTKSGKTIPIEMSSRKLSDGRYQAFFRDITDRIKTQALLHANEERFRNIMSASFDGIIVFDNDKILEANEVFLNMIKYKLHQILQMSLYQFINDNSKKILAKNLSEKNESTSEIVLVSGTGESISVEIRARNLVFIGTEAKIAFIRDITERKNKDLQLFKYQNQLEEIVDEQTKELKEKNTELNINAVKQESQRRVLEKALIKLEETKTQLIQSEKMASIGTLTAGITHEINTPINFISNGIDGLNEHLNDIIALFKEYRKININNFAEKIQVINVLENRMDIEYSIAAVQKMTNIIHNGVNRTVEIIKNLRNFSSFDNKAIIRFNIYENINTVLVILHSKYKDRVDIIKNYDNLLPEIESNSGKITQIFMNILLNAIQAIKEKGKIIITTGHDILKNAIMVSIKDDGIGIPRNIMNKIYDPFFTTKEIGEGTGIGLSIVYNYVKELNGIIEVKSEVNKGTEFIIFFPININN